MGQVKSNSSGGISSNRFVDAEKALRIDDSKGGRQSRLHLFDYKGKEGMDRYAVAAEKMNFKADSDAKLGWLDRRYYVLYKPEGSETWYKVNKESLRKRLNISQDEVQIDSNGICTNLQNLLQDKNESFKKWTGLSNASTSFEHQCLRSLVESGIPDFYKKIIFRSATSDQSISVDLDYEPGSVLIINYIENEQQIPKDFHEDDKTKFGYLLASSASPFNVVDLDFKSYERMVQGKELKKGIRDKIGLNLNQIFESNVEQFLYSPSTVSDEIKKDKGAVLAAVRKRGRALEFADDALKNDKELVLEAVENDGSALEFASTVLKNDREMVLKAVKKNGEALYHASLRLRKSKVVALAAVMQDGQSLRFASDALRNDREVVTAAINQDHRALQYAGNALKGDRTLVRLSIERGKLSSSTS